MCGALLQVGDKFNLMLARTIHTDGTPETGTYDEVGGDKEGMQASSTCPAAACRDRQQQ
jgi:hypothetical protein